MAGGSSARLGLGFDVHMVCRVLRCTRTTLKLVGVGSVLKRTTRRMRHVPGRIDKFLFLTKGVMHCQGR